MKMIALQPRGPYGARVKVGETFVVNETDAALWQRLGWAEPAPEGSPEPVFDRTARTKLKRRDIAAAPATVALEPEPQVVGAMATAGGIGSTTPPAAKRGRGRPRKGG